MFFYHYIIKENTFGSLLLLFSVSVIFGTSEIIKLVMNNGEDILKISTYNWIIRLCLNLLGYATVLLPGCLIYKYVRYMKYIQRGGKYRYGKNKSGLVYNVLLATSLLFQLYFFK